MPAPLNLTHDPALYQRVAFTCLCWAGLTFEAALFDAGRRDIIDHIATHWPHRPMENIVSISRISYLATDAARRRCTLRDVNPYPEHSAPGQLFAKCFHLEQKHLLAQATRARTAIESVAATEGALL